MRLQRRIIFASAIISIVSLFLYIAFSTFWLENDNNAIGATIFISVFGSSLLVLVPAVITFFKIKTETKQKIISELYKVENLINDVHFQTTFLKDSNGQYNLDFSFEKLKYNISDSSQYLALKDSYEIITRKVDSLYETLKKIDKYDLSFYNTYLNDYVGLFSNESLIHNLSRKYLDIVGIFMINNYPIPYGYGTRQFEASNATMGQFFDIWFRHFLMKLEPIDKKFEQLRTIFLILHLRFYKSDYKETINANEPDKKHELKKYIEQFFDENKINKTRFIKKLIKKLEKPTEKIKN